MAIPSDTSSSAALGSAWVRAPASAGPLGADRGPSPASAGFAKVWSGLSGSPSQVVVQRGDTLIGLVKAHYRQQSLPLTEHQAYRLAHQVAADNGIANANRILPGQTVDFARLALPALARGGSSPELAFTASEQALAQRHWRTPTPVPPHLLGQSAPAAGPNAPATAMGSGDHPVLNQTLGRAVDKGFIQSEELPAIKARVMALADRFRFAPDDFARLTLMESGGMNPRASNGRCHGVIQFCDGPARGAASVGFKDNPRAILGLPLLQQLDLVERYFTQVGLEPDKGQDKVTLDDLYLSVLTPAARSEKRRNVPLDIAGPQASYLHVDRDRQKPITRDSLVSGLYAYTNAVLQGPAARNAMRQFAQTGIAAGTP